MWFSLKCYSYHWDLCLYYKMWNVSIGTKLSLKTRVPDISDQGYTSQLIIHVDTICLLKRCNKKAYQLSGVLSKMHNLSLIITKHQTDWFIFPYIWKSHEAQEKKKLKKWSQIVGDESWQLKATQYHRLGPRIETGHWKGYSQVDPEKSL